MRHHAGELSRGGRLLRFFSPLRSLKGIPVAACDRSNAASDVLVGIVGQIGQGHAQGPVWCLEAPAVQQYYPVILGQTESEVERVNILLRESAAALSEVLPAQKSKV